MSKLVSTLRGLLKSEPSLVFGAIGAVLALVVGSLFGGVQVAAVLAGLQVVVSAVVRAHVFSPATVAQIQADAAAVTAGAAVVGGK